MTRPSLVPACRMGKGVSRAHHGFGITPGGHALLYLSYRLILRGSRKKRALSTDLDGRAQTPPPHTRSVTAKLTAAGGVETTAMGALSWDRERPLLARFQDGLPEALRLKWNS